ncbi:uncharacterized protein AB675_3704 [Cyphellophora attinorum]|uniref:Uncharacterized protein n=1 Tax=Cyphellophora attinorum TaxID=1664694 RepID=A0A0N0NJN3_9EURO|nr:uncharacterized protein AB675_3704 [Phialophora attinorum]KPI37088.1 hypothetical protein AB675_3704 [Phialophora attinorum]
MAPILQLSTAALSLCVSLIAWLRSKPSNPFSTADIEPFHISHYLSNNTIRSWEQGVWTQALLEVHNPELTVFATNPFPHGRLPMVPCDLHSVPGLASAAAYTQVNGTLLCDGGGSPADPASLGTQAVLLSSRDPCQTRPAFPSAEAFRDAAKSQAEYLLHNATKFHINETHAATSHRDEPPELWGDFVYTVPPFMAYYGVAVESAEYLDYAVRECQLYNEALATDVRLASGAQCSGLWRHIVSEPRQLPKDVCCTDPYVWLTSNAWAIAGMTRVLASLKPWTTTRLRSWSDDGRSFDRDAAIASLTNIIKDMLNCLILQTRGDDSDLLKNYLDGPGSASSAWAFGDAAGTALVTSAVYRLATLLPEVFAKPEYMTWADRNLFAVAKHVHQDGRVGPVAQINGVPSTKAVDTTSEGQSMALLLYAARRDFLRARGWLGRLGL